jgi:integrase
MNASYNDLSFLEEKVGDNRLKASWLNDFHSDTWVIDGKTSIDWNRKMRDDSILTSKENEFLLATIKRYVFEVRRMSGGQPLTKVELNKKLRHILALSDWMLIEGTHLSPKTCGFSRIDTDAIKTIAYSYATGGLNSMYGLTEVTIKHLKQIANDNTIRREIEQKKDQLPKTLFINPDTKCRVDFSIEELNTIKCWLYLNGCYKDDLAKNFASSRHQIARKKVRHIISPGKLLKATGRNPGGSLPDPFIYFTLQFSVVGDIDEFEELRRLQHRNYLPQGYKPLRVRAKEHAAEKSIKGFAATFETFASLTPFIDGLPSITTLKSADFVRYSKSFELKKASRTRTVPADYVLRAIGSSINYILDYGEALIDAVRALSSSYIEIYNERIKQSNAVQSHRYAYKTAWKNHTLPTALDDLNITKPFMYALNDGCKEGISFDRAVLHLYASVFILTAAMTGKRYAELINLPIGCADFKGDQGYWIRAELGKANFDDIRALIDRPIPQIVKKGITQLEALSGLKMDASKSKDSMLLFSPSFYPGRLTEAKWDLMKHIDQFCDFIELPLVDNRRWYFKAHEFRRFFAITFFWQFKHANLSALSWMLGHINPEHTYHYIKECVGGSEMNAVEASYTAEQVRDSGNCSSGLVLLKEMALKHFGTSKVELIETDDLEEYFEELLEKNVYQVRPHSIETDDGVIHEMVFEIIQEAKTS